jgi:cyclophilin family peptidyl-prolyl cis-trans isomerase
MSKSNRPFLFDARTVLGLVVVAWIGLTAYLLFGPTTSNQGGSLMPAAAASETKKGSEKGPIALIETSMGPIKVRLFADKAPKTVENFVDLVDKEFYDGIIFHRVIKDFMVQTGDPTGTGRGGRTDKGLPRKALADEFHPALRHDRPGILSMANAGPNTGDTQFFITTVPTAWLDDKHAVFGEVIDGMDVLKKIEGVRTGAQDRPLDPPKILKIRMIEPKSDAGDSPEAKNP